MAREMDKEFVILNSIQLLLTFGELDGGFCELIWLYLNFYMIAFLKFETHIPLSLDPAPS